MSKEKDVKTPDAAVVDAFKAERERALAEQKVVMDLPQGGGTAPSLRVDH